MAMAAHNGGDGTSTGMQHDGVRALGTTDVLPPHPWACGPPAAARRGSRWA